MAGDGGGTFSELTPEPREGLSEGGRPYYFLLLSVDPYSCEAFKFYFKSPTAGLLKGTLETDPLVASEDS